MNITRRNFLNSMLATAATGAGSRAMSATTNKREAVLKVLDTKSKSEYVPAAFFLHFERSYHFGPAAVEKHLEYFRATGMDFVKIQYELGFPALASIQRPEDWTKMPRYGLDFYERELGVVRGLVEAAKKEALVLVTVYSPFMCAGQSSPLLKTHLEQDPEPVRKGLEIVTDSLMLFVKECVRIGVDGFYASTQGGEAGRFRDPGIFKNYIKPFDLALMQEMNRSCAFNILHVCDYSMPYADFSPFLDYPGHVVNVNPQLVGKRMTWNQVAQLFKRPCMGGLERKGTIVSGSKAAIEQAVDQVLRDAPRPFILGADCTVPSDIPWTNLRTAIEAAHNYRRG